MLKDKMITSNLLLLVFLCLWEGLTAGAATGKIVRRKGVGTSHLGKLGEKDGSMDAKALPVVTLRNLISYEQTADAGAFSYPKLLQSRATQPAANREEGRVKERKAFKPKREVDSVDKKETALHASNRGLVQEAKKVKNNTKNLESKTGKSDKSGHHKSELHANRTRFVCRARCRADPGIHTTGVPGKSFSTDAVRKLNLTGSYGVLKLLSKENLVRIVNSQMQSVPSRTGPSKGGRSRKRDLIDVNHGQVEAQKVQRQDLAITQLHSGSDNQTALPYVSPATAPGPDQDQDQSAPDNPHTGGQARVELQGSESGDSRSKHLTRVLSTPRSEVSLGPEKAALTSQTEPPLPSTKHFPPHVLAATNDAPPSVLTTQPLGARGGAADSHGDPLAESVHSAQTEVGTAQYPPDEDNQLVNSSHVLKLQPAPEWSRAAEEPATQVGRSRNGKGLVFEEAEEDTERAEPTGPRSRSRRSWIWNQFFVIEEYAGPEPVLIGRRPWRKLKGKVQMRGGQMKRSGSNRAKQEAKGKAESPADMKEPVRPRSQLHTDMDRNDGRTKYVLRGEGAGSVFVIDEKTGNIHVTKPLDREEKDEYRLIATATDRLTDRALEPSSQFIIRVQDINDNPPVFDEGPYSATVPEMANIATGGICSLAWSWYPALEAHLTSWRDVEANEEAAGPTETALKGSGERERNEVSQEIQRGTSIIQVTATDADDPTYGNSAKLVYTLVQGQQYFSVDPQTGILRTAVPDMDRETQDQYLVLLQAKDMGGHLGGLSGTTTVTVKLSDVNDNPPRFTQSKCHSTGVAMAEGGGSRGGGTEQELFCDMVR
ncbi:unnamed protein product [Tetraodon nigroviridis]|uniref:(spotted green pufferfish) hypothetical protein n=1 Tax=Tetraodon nigroviridis TaxID=99883 RepID=Q4SNR2_TETNG|nr:unnamed protein product [Tetraodon nigroviridis]